MKQHVFPFAQPPLLEQLELFDDSVYDNRMTRLSYALRISYRVNGWRPYNVDSLTECVKLFRVKYEDVLNQYAKLIESESERFN